MIKTFVRIAAFAFLCLPAFAQTTTAKPVPQYPANCTVGSEASCDPTGGVGTFVVPATNASAWNTFVASGCSFNTSFIAQGTYTYVGGGTASYWCPSDGATAQTIINTYAQPGDTIIMQSEGVGLSNIYRRTPTGNILPLKTPGGQQSAEFYLPARYNPSGKLFTFLTSGSGALPTIGSRILPARDRPSLTRLDLNTGNNDTPFIVTPYADFWQMRGIEVSTTSSFFPSISPWLHGSNYSLFWMESSTAEAQNRGITMTTSHETAYLGRAVGIIPTQSMIWSVQCSAGANPNCINETAHGVAVAIGQTSSIDIIGQDSIWCDNVTATCVTGYGQTKFTLGTGIVINSITYSGAGSFGTCPAAILSGACQKATISVSVNANAYIGPRSGKYQGISPSHRIMVKTPSIAQPAEDRQEWFDDGILVTGTGVPQIIGFTNTTAGTYSGTNAVPFSSASFTGQIATQNTVGSIGLCQTSGGHCTVAYDTGSSPGSLVGQPMGLSTSVITPVDDTHLNFTGTLNTSFHNPGWNWIQLIIGQADSSHTTQVPAVSSHSFVQFLAVPSGATSWVQSNSCMYVLPGESYNCDLVGHNTTWASGVTPAIDAIQLPLASGTTGDLQVSLVSVTDNTHARVLVSSPDSRTKRQGPYHILCEQCWIHGYDGNVRVANISTVGPLYGTANNGCPGATAGYLTAGYSQLCPSADGMNYVDNGTEQEVANGVVWAGVNNALVDSWIGQVHSHDAFSAEAHGLFSSIGPGPFIARNTMIEGGETEMSFTAGTYQLNDGLPIMMHDMALININAARSPWLMPMGSGQGIAPSMLTTPYTMTSNGSGVITSVAGATNEAMHNCPNTYAYPSSFHTSGTAAVLSCTLSSGIPVLSIVSGGNTYTASATIPLVLSYGICPNVANNSCQTFSGSAGDFENWGFKNGYEWKHCYYCLLWGSVQSNSIAHSDGQPGEAIAMQPFASFGQGHVLVGVQHVNLLSNWFDKTWTGYVINANDQNCTNQWEVYDDMACAEPESSDLNLEYPGGTNPYLETLFSGKLYDVRGYNNLGTHRSSTDGTEMTNGIINLIFGNNPELAATPQVGRDIILQHNTWILRPGASDSATYEGLYFPYTGTNGMTWPGWTNNSASSGWNVWMLDNVTTCPPSGDNGGQGFNAAGLYSYMGCPTDSGLSNPSCTVSGATNVYGRYKGNVMAIPSTCEFHAAENWTLGGSTNYGVTGTTLGYANAGAYNSLVSPGDLTLTSPAYGAVSGNNNYTTSDGTTSGVNMAVLNSAIATALTGQPSTGLAIATTSLPDGTQFVLYNQYVVATGNTGAVTWSITVGSLPTGLSLTGSTGEITGTPTVAGLSSFTVQACDSLTCVSQPLSINIDTSMLPGSSAISNGVIQSAVFQ